MEAPIDLNELTERIRRAATHENGLASGGAREYASASELPPAPESLSVPSSQARTVALNATRPEVLLDGAASMLRGGREKTTVAKGVPKLLRSLFRNQGGYNSVLLEAVERLVEVNRTLTQQNTDLYDRVMDLHTWAHSAAEISAENRGWALAATARLQAFSEDRWSRLVERIELLEKHVSQGAQTPISREATTPPSRNVDQIEEQLERVTARLEATDAERHALNDHLNRLRAQVAEQAEYIRTVHRHLDQLGAHVDSALGQTRPA